MLPDTPLLSLVLDDDDDQYWPLEILAGEFQIDAVTRTDVRAVELSVMWETSGKGDTDYGVHYFQRWDWDRDEQQHDAWQRFEVPLPRSPLSYDGLLIKIDWLIRLRVTMRNGQEYLEEQPFQLGQIPRPALANAANEAREAT